MPIRFFWLININQFDLDTVRLATPFFLTVFKKLRRYFIDQKVPAKKRQEAIIIEQHKTILGVANQVTSDLSKPVKNDIMKTKLYIKTKE